MDWVFKYIDAKNIPIGKECADIIKSQACRSAFLPCTGECEPVDSVCTTACDRLEKYCGFKKMEVAERVKWEKFKTFLEEMMLAFIRKERT